MAFNRQKFIKLAKQNPDFTDEEINAGLMEMGEKPLSLVEKAVNSNVIPSGGALLGGAMGAVVGGPIGAIGGAGVGTGAGLGLKDAIAQLSGQTTYNPGESVYDKAGRDFRQVGDNTKTAAMIVPLLYSLYFGLNPGKAREKSLGNRKLPRDPLQEQLVTQENKYVTPEARQSFVNQRGSFMNKLFPYETSTQAAPGVNRQVVTQPNDVKINDLYKALTQLQKETGAFKDNKLAADTARDLSINVRNYINPNLTTGEKLLNDYMGMLAKTRTPLKILGAGAGSTAAGMATYNLLKGFIGR